MSRILYLVAYDVGDPSRLARVRRFLQGWRVAGQKSFFECWLTPAERGQVLEGLHELIDPVTDRAHLFQLDQRMTPHCFGIAHTFREGHFTIL